MQAKEEEEDSSKELGKSNSSSEAVTLEDLGRQVKIKIEYDSWRNNLEIFAAYYGDPLKSILNHSMVMSGTVPRPVYVGFTGLTCSGGSFETHRIINWAFATYPVLNYSHNDGPEGDKTKKILIIIFPIVTSALILVIFLLPLIRRCKWPSKKGRKSSREGIESRSRSAANAPKMFTFKELSKATHNFSKENFLRVGGFGSVYRGDISDPPLTIAVKRISATSGQDWPTRYGTIIGRASALLYLHEECGNVVIHRDVKTNNVMLDANYNAHLGDFGLARLLLNETFVTTNNHACWHSGVLSALVYTGKATTESDVFSIGIVVLEVVRGRRTLGGIVSGLCVFWSQESSNSESFLEFFQPWS
ncbi:LOW QUALITY PROTEIN: Protein kinase domain-containing protein [Cinnamomum micranthum f. kanehirae]|uniref:Protein kinase domain-containing protein n=1 Tax=Cinnamomum micranthum f. kanehirae TaxID=337451 RepID=A0A443N491_9MAGN|nr:LOW QUALITY PROTEIN: Protein kinase domain-containing protein [Cinnamomum micranthum f. kanehirae]